MNELFTKLNKPRIYYYFDTDGIESLYSQTVTRVQTEFLNSKEKKNGGKIIGKIGLGRFVSSFLGELGGETEISLSEKITEETKSMITVEHKLNNLLYYIAELRDDNYFTNLGFAAANCTRQRDGVFINISNKFDMPQFYNSNDPIEEINSTKYVSFYIGPPLPKNYENADIYSDYYYKSYKGYSFFMSTRIDKCPRIKNSLLMPLNHDAVFFRSHKGKSVPLNVFGYLNPLGTLGRTFQIKPFAIWLD